MKLIRFSIPILLLFSLYTNAQDLVVVVNKSNTVNDLSKREVIDIYMGRYVTFPDGESAKPFDLPAESQLKNDFYLKLVNQNERKINAYWARVLFSGRAKPPESVQSINEVLSHLQNSESAIAYIPESEVTDIVKVVYRLNEN
jgi:ABC-type phosphate transport system substrate-binding protein